MEIQITSLEKENSELLGRIKSQKSQLDGVNNLLNLRNQKLIECQEELNKMRENDKLVKILSEEVKALRRENERYKNTIVWLGLNAQFPENFMED